MHETKIEAMIDLGCW